MYKFKEAIYEKKYISSGGGNITAYFVFPDVNLNKFMDKEQNYNFCFGKISDTLKTSQYCPVVLSEENAHDLCNKCLDSYIDNWSLCDTFCIFGMLIAKFNIDEKMVQSITETSFEQFDGSYYYDMEKMKDPIITYKAQSSQLKHGLISFEVMKKLKEKPYELYYHVDERLKSCFTMFNLLNMSSHCLKILQILYSNKNTFKSVDNMDTLLHKASLPKSRTGPLIERLEGGKRKSKKHSKRTTKKHSKKKTKNHSKSQKGGKTDIVMKKQYNDLVKEYYKLEKQAKQKNII